MTCCVSSYNPCRSITYTSLRPTIILDEETNPIEEASIAIYSIFDYSGNLYVVVQNLTDDILTIDQTKSFVVMPDKQSKPYYDSTIRTQSSTSSISQSNGMSFNLGNIANVIGIGGVGKSLLSSMNIGGSQSSSSGTTYTEILADMPQVSIGPRGKMAMSKTFNLGIPNANFISATPETSPFTFSVIISYSFDNGNTYDLIRNDFYCNASIIESVYNGNTNDAIRSLISTKPNATLESWYMLRNSRSTGLGKCSTFINYQ